jgi:hypothetical protein
MQNELYNFLQFLHILKMPNLKKNIAGKMLFDLKIYH